MAKKTTAVVGDSGSDLNALTPFEQHKGRGVTRLEMQSRSDTSVFRRVHQTLSIENLASQVLDLETGFSSFSADFSMTPQRMLESVVEVSEEERGQRIDNNNLSDAETQGVYWPATAIKRVLPVLGKELVSVYGGTFTPAKPGKKEAEWSLSGKIPRRRPSGNIFPDNEADALTKESTGRYLAQLQADTDNVAMVLNRLPAIALNTALRTISPYGGAGAYLESADLGMLSANMADEKDAPGLMRVMWPAAQTTYTPALLNMYLRDALNALRDAKEVRAVLTKEATKAWTLSFDREGLERGRMTTLSLLADSQALEGTAASNRFLEALAAFLPKVSQTRAQPAVSAAGRAVFIAFLQRLAQYTANMPYDDLTTSGSTDVVLPMRAMGELPLMVLPLQNTASPDGSRPPDYALMTANSASNYYRGRGITKVVHVLHSFPTVRVPDNPIYARDVSALMPILQDPKSMTAERTPLFKSLERIISTMNAGPVSVLSLPDKAAYTRVVPYVDPASEDFGKLVNIISSAGGQNEYDLNNILVAKMFPRDHSRSKVHLTLNVPSELDVLHAISAYPDVAHGAIQLNFMQYAVCTVSYAGKYNPEVSKGKRPEVESPEYLSYLVDAFERKLPKELIPSIFLEYKEGKHELTTDMGQYAPPGISAMLYHVLNKAALKKKREHNPEYTGQISAPELLDAIEAVEPVDMAALRKEMLGDALVADGYGTKLSDDEYYRVVSLLRAAGAYFTGYIEYKIPAIAAFFMSQTDMEPYYNDDGTRSFAAIPAINVQKMFGAMIGGVLERPTHDTKAITTVTSSGVDMPAFSVPEDSISAVVDRRKAMGIATKNIVSSSEGMSITANGKASFVPDVAVEATQANLRAYAALAQTRYSLYARLGIAPNRDIVRIPLSKMNWLLTPGAPDYEERANLLEKLNKTVDAMQAMSTVPLLVDTSLGVLLGSGSAGYESRVLSNNGPLADTLVEAHVNNSLLSTAAYPEYTPDESTAAMWATLVGAKQVPSLDDLFNEAVDRWESVAGAPFSPHFSPELGLGEVGTIKAGGRPWPIDTTGFTPYGEMSAQSDGTVDIGSTFVFDVKFDLPEMVTQAYAATGEVNLADAMRVGNDHAALLAEEAVKFMRMLVGVRTLLDGGFSSHGLRGDIFMWLRELASSIKPGLERTPQSAYENLLEAFSSGIDAHVDSDEVQDFGSAGSKRLEDTDHHSREFYTRYTKEIPALGESLKGFGRKHSTYLQYFVLGTMFLLMLERLLAAVRAPDCVLYTPMQPKFAYGMGRDKNGNIKYPISVNTPSFHQLCEDVIPPIFLMHAAGLRKKGEWGYKRDRATEALARGTTFNQQVALPYVSDGAHMMAHQIAAADACYKDTADVQTRERANQLRVEPGGGKTILGVALFLRELDAPYVREYYAKMYNEDGSFKVTDPAELQQLYSECPFRPLVVCPKGLKGNWAEDTYKFTGSSETRFFDSMNVYPISSEVLASRPIEVIHAEIMAAPPNTLFVTDYSTLTNHRKRAELRVGAEEFTVHETLTFFLNVGFTHVYFDEAHKLKNPELDNPGATTRLHGMRLAQAANAVFQATGTAAPNTPDDDKGMGTVLVPGLFGNEMTADAIAGRSPEAISARLWRLEDVRQLTAHLRHGVNVVSLSQSNWAYALPTPEYVTHVIDTLGNINTNSRKVTPEAGKNGQYSADVNVAIRYLWDRKYFSRWGLRDISEVYDELTNFFAIYNYNLTAMLNEATEASGGARKSSTVEDEDDENEGFDADDGGDDNLKEMYAIYVKLIQFLGDPINDDLNNPASQTEGGKIMVSDQGGENLRIVTLPKLRIPGPKLLYLYYLLLQHFASDLAYKKTKEGTAPVVIGRKVVVASKYKRTITAALSALPAELKEHATLVMGTLTKDQNISSEFALNPKEAANNLQAFKNSDQTWLMFSTTDKMGEGFNLQMGNRIISLEQPITGGERLQLVSRVRRPDIAQKYSREKVYLESIVLDGTLDVTMLSVFSSKYATMMYSSNSTNTENTLWQDLKTLPRLKLNLKTFRNLRNFADLRKLAASDFIKLPEDLEGKTFDYVGALETCYAADRRDCARALERNLAIAQRAGEVEGDPLKYLVPVVDNNGEQVVINGEPLFKPKLLQKVERKEAVAGTRPMLFSPVIDNVPASQPRMFGFDVESMQQMFDVYSDVSSEDMVRTGMGVYTEFGFGRVLGFNKDAVMVLFPNGTKRSFSASRLTLLGNVTPENQRMLTIMLDVDGYNEEITKTAHGEKASLLLKYCEYERVPGGVQKWQVHLTANGIERIAKIGPVMTEDSSGVPFEKTTPYFDRMPTTPPFSRQQRIMLPVARVEVGGIFWFDNVLYRIKALEAYRPGKLAIDRLNANTVGVVLVCDVVEAEGDSVASIGREARFRYAELCEQGLHINFNVKPSVAAVYEDFLLFRLGEPLPDKIVFERTIGGNPVPYTRDMIRSMVIEQARKLPAAYINPSLGFDFGGQSTADSNGTYLEWDDTSGLVARWLVNNKGTSRPVVVTEAFARAVEELIGWYGSEGKDRRATYTSLVTKELGQKPKSSARLLGLGSEADIAHAGGVQARAKELGVKEDLPLVYVPASSVTKPAAPTAPAPTKPTVQSPAPAPRVPSGTSPLPPAAGSRPPVSLPPAPPASRRPAGSTPTPPLPSIPLPTVPVAQVAAPAAQVSDVSIQVVPILSQLGQEISAGSFTPVLALTFAQPLATHAFLKKGDLQVTLGGKVYPIPRDKFVLQSYTDVRITKPSMYYDLVAFLKEKNIEIVSSYVNREGVGMVGSLSSLEMLLKAMKPDGSFQTHLSPELANVKLTHVFKQSADVDKSGNRIGNLQQMSVNPVVLYDEKGERLHLLVRTQNVMAVKRLQQAAAALSWPAGTVKPPSSMLFLATLIKKPEQYAAIIDALRAELNLDPAQCERAKVEAEQLLRGKLIAS